MASHKFDLETRMAVFDCLQRQVAETCCLVLIEQGVHFSGELHTWHVENGKVEASDGRPLLRENQTHDDRTEPDRLLGKYRHLSI